MDKDANGMNKDFYLLKEVWYFMMSPYDFDGSTPNMNYLNTYGGVYSNRVGRIKDGGVQFLGLCY